MADFMHQMIAVFKGSDDEEVIMLKLNEIKFPVVFNTISCGKITCHSKDRATDSSFNECHPSIVGNLIELHNNHNPDNIPSLPYYVESAGPDHVYMESQQSCDKAREVIAENKPFGYEVKTMCVKR